MNKHPERTLWVDRFPLYTLPLASRFIFGARGGESL